MWDYDNLFAMNQYNATGLALLNQLQDTYCQCRCKGHIWTAINTILSTRFPSTRILEHYSYIHTYEMMYTPTYSHTHIDICIQSDPFPFILHKFFQCINTFKEHAFSIGVCAKGKIFHSKAHRNRDLIDFDKFLSSQNLKQERKKWLERYMESVAPKRAQAFKGIAVIPPARAQA